MIEEVCDPLLGDVGSVGRPREMPHELHGNLHKANPAAGQPNAVLDRLASGSATAPTHAMSSALNVRFHSCTIAALLTATSAISASAGSRAEVALLAAQDSTEGGAPCGPFGTARE